MSSSISLEAESSEVTGWVTSFEGPVVDRVLDEGLGEEGGVFFEDGLGDRRGEKV